MQKSRDYVVEFTVVAREDVREIVWWYRNEREGLEDRFLFSLKVSLNELGANPLIHPIQFQDIRAVLLKRFPYKVYYTLLESNVIILGVIHTKRSPKLIRKRLK